MLGFKPSGNRQGFNKRNLIECPGGLFTQEKASYRYHNENHRWLNCPHSILWDGNNDRGESVSSGFIFIASMQVIIK